MNKAFYRLHFYRYWLMVACRTLKTDWKNRATQDSYTIVTSDVQTQTKTIAVLPPNFI